MMEDANQRDLYLMAQIQERNESAFEELRCKYKPQIYSHIRSFYLSHEDTEELVNDVFLNVYRGAQKYTQQPGSPVSAWIFTIANNLSKNKKRSISCRIPFVQNKDDPDFKEAMQQPIYDTQVLHNEWKSIIDKAWESLNPPDRDCLNLYLNEDYSYQSLADRLGVSIETVKSRIYRARDALKVYNRGIIREYLLDFQRH